MAKIGIVDNGDGTETITIRCAACGKKHTFVNGANGEPKAFFWSPDHPTVRKEVLDLDNNQRCHFAIRNGIQKVHRDSDTHGGEFLPMVDLPEDKAH